MMWRHSRNLLIIALLALGMALAAHAATAPAGALQVQLASRPSPPKIGVNQFLVTLTRSGKPVTGAGVRLHLDMVGMSMPADVKATPAKAAGQYTGSARLAMAGTWKITVSVQQMAGMKMAGDGEARFVAQTGRAIRAGSSRK